MNAPAVEPEPFDRVRDLLGANLLRYLLALDADALLEAESILGDGRRKSAQFLIELVTSGRLMTDDDHARAFDLPRILGASPPGQQLALTNALRIQSGGEVPTVSVISDPVANAMASVLGDVYPILLIPEGRHFGVGPSLSSVTYPNTALRSAVQGAIADDADLSRLFAGHDDMGPVVTTTRSTGQGSGVQLAMFPGQQIVNAWERAQLTREDPTIAEISDALCANLDAIRATMRKEAATIPATVGLTGVLLPDGVREVDVGWGCIRPATDRERVRASAFGGGGRLTSTSSSGATVAIDYAGDLVLQVDVPYALRLGMIENGEPWPRDLQTAQAKTASTSKASS